MGLFSNNQPSKSSDIGSLKLPKEYKILQDYRRSSVCIDECYEKRTDYEISTPINRGQLIDQLKNSFTATGYNYQPSYPYRFCSNQTDKTKSKNNVNPVGNDNIRGCSYSVEDYFYRDSEDCPVVSLLVNDKQLTADKISEFGLTCDSQLSTKQKIDQIRGKYPAKNYPIWLKSPFTPSELQYDEKKEYFTVNGIIKKEDVISQIEQQMAQNPQFVKSKPAGASEYPIDIYYKLKDENCDLTIYAKPRLELNLSVVLVNAGYGSKCRYSPY